MEGKFSLSFFVHLFSALVDDFCWSNVSRNHGGRGLLVWGIHLVCVTRLGGLKYYVYVRIMGGCWSLVSDKVIQTLFVSCVPSLSVACLSCCAHVSQ